MTAVYLALRCYCRCRLPGSSPPPALPTFRRRTVLLAAIRTAPSFRLRSLSSSAASTTTPASSSSGSSNSDRTSKRRIPASAAAAIAAACLGIGYVAGSISSTVPQHRPARVLPDGLPRTCCDEGETTETRRQEEEEVIRKFQSVVGKDNVIDGRKETTSNLSFLKGARLGRGTALCVVTPRRLVEVADVVQIAVDAGCVVLPQGQNTGLTGGSVPHLHDGKDDDDQRRPTVVLSMKYLDRIFPIDDGKRVVCLAGVGLASLSKFLERYFPNRESHSQLGSTFLNPTTAAGVAFGSGGTQLRKGPAYTERALYLKVRKNKWNENVVEVVNTLGIEGMHDKHLPEGRERKHMDSVAYRLDTWSRWIRDGRVQDMRYSCTATASEDNNNDSKFGNAPASDTDYVRRVCQYNSSEVSRYNADTRGPDPNRSEGKVVILATVHDTFEKPRRTKSFWISFDSLETALQFRREVCLDNPADLPVSLEYMDRDAYDVIDRSGRVTALAINLFGTASTAVRYLWNCKLWIESLPVVGAPLVVDKLLHTVNNLIPSVLPRSVKQTAQKYDHHGKTNILDTDLL